MKAMILAAGLGTRMRPLTTHCPKPLLPLMLQPTLGHILGQLQDYKVREVVINVHHHAEQLAAWLGDGSRWGIRLHLSVEPVILGTAGAIKRAAPFFADAPFLLLNADVLMEVDLQALWHWHCQQGAMVTMVVRPDPAARSYGPVIIDADNRVRLIAGRPAPQATVLGEETIFTGLQVVNPEVLDRIPAEGFCTTTGEIYPALLEENQPLYGYRHHGYWMDIGVPARYLQAHRDLLNGQLADLWAQRLPPGARAILTPTAIPADLRQATVMPPVLLGAGVRLAAGACVGPYAVLGAGCQVGPSAMVQESVLWERVHVGSGAYVHQAVLANDVQVPARSQWSAVVRTS
ncbi:MAG: sugar phosphate nucleotidyltransferase [Candidatus Tectimicrobiota bacterium]